jgi:hypothetical protein
MKDRLRHFYVAAQEGAVITKAQISGNSLHGILS